MGIAVYLEDQIHGRTYAGSEAGTHLSKVLEVAPDGGLLSGINRFGDTMFNIVQLRQLEVELDAIAVAHPDLNLDVEYWKETFTVIIRNRGYLWLSGD